MRPMLWLRSCSRLILPCCSPHAVAAGLGVAVGTAVGAAEAGVVGVVGCGIALGRGSAGGRVMAAGADVATAPADGAQPAHISKAISASRCCLRQLATPGSSARA